MAEEGVERRRHARYPTQVEAHVRRRGNVNVFRSQSVEVVDFNRHCCSIDADGEFELGDSLLVTASVAGASITNIRGTVRSIRRNGDLSRLGIEFDYDRINERGMEMLYRMELVVEAQ